MKPLLVLICLLLPILAHAQTVDDGYIAYEAGDYAKAKSIFHSLAAEENAKAMNAIGVLYSKGKGYTQNRKVACDWYEKAAVKEYVPAQYNFADCFSYLGGRKKSLKKWREWHEKSGENGYLFSQTALMKFYIDTNMEKATYWANKAAAQNNAFARVSLWLMDKDTHITPVSFTEVICVFTKLYLFEMNVDHCDN